MSRSLGVLTLDLIARTGGFEQGMDRASRRVRTTAQDMEAAKRTADRFVMAIGAAGVAFASAAAAMAVQSAKAMDATAKMAQQIGTTTEALSGMRFAAQQFANISDQQFDMAMRRMTRRIAEAAEGSGSAKKALDAMGLSARELARLSPDKQMLAIADAMQRTERQADRLRHTMAIFDTEGMALVPALQQGAAAFEQNIELARRFGVVVSTEAAQAAEQFTTNMGLLSKAQEGFRNQLAEALLPMLADLSGRLVEISQRIGPMGDAIEKALKAAGVAAAATAAIFVSRLIGSITASAMAWTAATAEAARYQMALARMAASASGASAAITAMTGAAAGGMAVMGRAAQVALGVLGGPVGLVATIGLTAAGFLTMGRDAKTASFDIDELSESFRTLSAQKLELRMFDLEDEVQRLEKQAQDSGVILRTMKADVTALFESAAKGVNITAQELENARRSLLEQRDAHDTNNAELERARALLNQVTEHLERMKNAAHGAAGGVDALNQAMHSEAGEKFLAQLQGQIKALQDGGDPIKIATRWISEHADATEADKEAIMSAAHALKALQDARAASTRTISTATRTLTEAQRAAQNFRREQDQSLRSQLQAVSAIHSQARAIEDQIAVYGQGKTAIEGLTIARLEEQAAILRGFDGSREAVEAIEREIEARKRLRTAIGSLEQKEAEQQAWEDWARDVEQIFDRVGQSLTDAIFDGGRSAKDLLQNMFKSLTFNVLINPVMGAIQGIITGVGPAGAAAVGGAGAGLMGNAGGLLSLFGGNSMGTSISNVLTRLSTSNMLAGTGVGNWMSGVAGNVAGMSNLALGGAGLLGGLGAGLIFDGKHSGTLGGIGATAGMAIGGPIGAVAGSLLGGALGSLFGDREPTTRRGQRVTSEYGDGEYLITSRDGRQAAGTEDIVRQLAESAVQSTNELFERVGVAASVNSLFAITESSYKGDRQGVASGGTLRVGDALLNFGLQDLHGRSDLTKSGFGGWSEAEMLPRLEMDLQLSVLSAFQAAGDAMPKVLAGMLEGIDIRSLGEEQAQALAQSFQLVIEQVTGLQEAVERLPFAQLRDLSFDAAANLINFAGGLEALDAGMTAYFQNFYSEAEQLDWATQQIGAAFDELGLIMPDVTQGAELAKAAYRDLVESLDVTTEEGQRSYATLMTLSGGFAELVTGLDQLNNAVVETARSAADIARERESLERQLLQIEGDTAELRRRDLLLIDESNRSLQELIWARLDEIDAAAEAARAIEEAQQRAAAIAQERYNLETQLLQLLGDTDTLRARQLATLDESNHALQRRIWALQDEAQAAQDAERAARDFASTMQSAYSALVSAGQTEIRELEQSFVATDIAMSAYRNRVEQLRSDLMGVIDVMRDGVRALRGEADQTAAMQYSQARAVISTALVTGRLPQTADLSEAIQAAQQGVMDGVYATRFERDKAYLELANEIEEVQQIAEPQLTAAEATLERLEEQYDLLRGTHRVTSDSLEVLESQLRTALAAEELARAEIDIIQSQLDYAKGLYDRMGGVQRSIEAGFSALLSQFAKLTGETVPAFASGGVYTGGLALVGERGPELINFSRGGYVHTATQTNDILGRVMSGGGQQGNWELVEENRLLRRQVEKMTAYLYQITKETKRTAQHTEPLERSTDDLVVVF